MENGLYPQPRFRNAGDRGLLVEYGDRISPAINRRVRATALLLDQQPPAGVVEVIPTYRSLLIVYDPTLTAPHSLQEAIATLGEEIDPISIPPPRVVEIPVCYGSEYGPDIQQVAATHDLRAAEVVRIHSEPDYLIYMIGFTPGFPFLGGLPEQLHTPRHETPRTHVPAGSVGIANDQTGIYPVDSPGGWQIIGRTPLQLFSPHRDNPFLFETGDCIRFIPISPQRFQRYLDEAVSP